MSLIGLDKFRKYPVLKEILPVKDENGEFTEVQVLEEGEIPEREIPGDIQVTVFDPDEFIERLKQLQPECPRCQVPMRYGTVSGSDGENFEYYRCPTKSWGTKCYVTRAVNEVNDYLRRVKKQTHPCYKKIGPARFRCEYDL